MYSTPYSAACGTHEFASAHFVYVPDAVQHRLIDHWPSFDEISAAINSGDGILRDDCDGFARLCQWHLAQNRMPNAALLCLVETGEAHLVCEVGGTPTQSGWIMDNRRSGVTTRERLAEEGYEFLLYAESGRWITIKQSK